MLIHSLERLVAVASQLGRRRQAGRSLTAMGMLNDHTLRDIGINRCQIAGFSTMTNDNNPADIRHSA